MKMLSMVPLALLLLFLPACASLPDMPEPASHVETLASGGRILIEEVHIDAPVAAVWDAYVTVEGWTAWVSPVAAIDLRPGGLIQSNYNKDAQIGDDGTNELQIVNFVPERLLTLRADVSELWPGVMQKDADNLMNVIIFDDLGDQRTRLQSFGLGYGDAEEYEELLGFFLEANAGLYVDLKRYLELGERSTFGGESAGEH